MEPDVFEALLQSVRDFVRERLVPLEKQVDDEDRIPDELVAEMREMGFFGLSIPTEYGGLGLTAVEEARVAFEFGWTSPAFRSIFGTNIGIGSQGILLDGTDEQKRTYLPRMASGELIASFCLTEPQSGSDAASLQTRAERVDGGYRLTGTKRYITNAPRAGVFTVMARTHPNLKGAAGVSAFVVDATSSGLSLGKPERKLGQRGTAVCDVIFDGCFVPDSGLIGGVPGKGFSTAMRVLDRGRLNIGAFCVGTAERLIDEMVRYADGRVQFGKPISSFQLIQAMIADSEVEKEAALALVLQSARLRDDMQPIVKAAAMSKYYASEMVGRVADRAVQVFGGAGYIAEYCVERFYRDVRLFRIYEGTSQIQQLIIAREVLKEHRE